MPNYVFSCLCSIPFERNSIHGFLFYSFLGYIVCAFYCGLLFVYTQFFLGVCFYLDAFCEDFIDSIRNIEKLRDKIVKNTTAIRDRIQYEREFRKKICEAVEFQGDIIE